MAKTGKQNNDLRTVRKETAIVIGLSGLFCILLFATAVWQSELNPLICGIFVLVLYAAACTAAILLLEKRMKNGAGSETLAPVMGRIMFDAVVKMNNPVFICDCLVQHRNGAAAFRKKQTVRGIGGGAVRRDASRNPQR